MDEQKKQRINWWIELARMILAALSGLLGASL